MYTHTHAIHIKQSIISTLIWVRLLFRKGRYLYQTSMYIVFNTYHYLLYLPNNCKIIL